MFQRSRSKTSGDGLRHTHGWTASLYQMFLGAHPAGSYRQLTIYVRRLERVIDAYAANVVAAETNRQIAKTTMTGVTFLHGETQRARVMVTMTFTHERWGRAQEIAAEDVGYLMLTTQSELSGDQTPVIALQLCVGDGVQRELCQMLLDAKSFGNDSLALNVQVDFARLVATTPAAAAAFFLESQLPVKTFSVRQVLDLAHPATEDGDELPATVSKGDLANVGRR